MAKILGLALVTYSVFTGQKGSSNSQPNNSDPTNNNNQDDYDELPTEFDVRTPAEKYLEITPRIIWRGTSGRYWTALVQWEIRNTQYGSVFNINKIKSTIIIGGKTAILVPGNNTVTRVEYGKTAIMECSLNAREFYQDSGMRDYVRDIIDNKVVSKDLWNTNVAKADVVAWVQGNGSTKEQKVVRYNIPLWMKQYGSTAGYFTNVGVIANSLWMD